MLIVDELDGDPSGTEIGSSWRSDAHVLIVLAGESTGPEYAVMHPNGCSDCHVQFQLVEGSYTQPTGYPQVPTEPGLYLMRAVTTLGGWLTAEFPVDHDCYLIFNDVIEETDMHESVKACNTLSLRNRIKALEVGWATYANEVGKAEGVLFADDSNWPEAVQFAMERQNHLADLLLATFNANDNGTPRALSNPFMIN